MKNKLITIIVLLSFFVPYMYAAGTVTVQNPTWLEEHFQRMTKIKQYWDNWNHKDFKKFMTEGHGENPRLMLYIAFLYFFILGVTDDVSKNLETYILMNPDPTKPEVLNVLNYFISNIQKLYILAIAATAFYMLFISLSPRQRAMSKYMLGKLVLGFLLVSISPYLLSLAYQFSEGMTAMILGQTDTRVVADEYNGMLWKCWWMTVGVISAPVVFEKTAWHKLEEYVKEKVKNTAMSRFYNPPPDVFNGPGGDTFAGWGTLDSLETTAEEQAMDTAKKETTIGRVFTLLEKVKITPQASFTFPFLMAAMLLIFGLYGFLALRYLMMMVWTVLFPLTIFFSSFELTKGLGRNMLEQTIFWLILQVFYAISLAVVSVGFALIPKGFEFFHIGPGDPFTFMTVSFFTLGGLLVFLLTPIFLLMMTQRRTA